MTMSELTSAFEAVLFSGGEPQSIDRFSQVFDITPEKVAELMEALSKRLDAKDKGVELVRNEVRCHIAGNTPLYTARYETCIMAKQCYDELINV